MILFGRGATEQDELGADVLELEELKLLELVVLGLELVDWALELLLEGAELDDEEETLELVVAAGQVTVGETRLISSETSPTLDIAYAPFPK